MEPSGPVQACNGIDLNSSVPDLEDCLRIFLNCLTAVCGVANEN
jgi:hypothetical protein